MITTDYRGRLRQLVLQPTPFCNLDCRYCYLPDRSNKALMPAEVLDAAFRLVSEAGLPAERLDVRWHAGEPLVAPVDFYASAFDRAERVLGGQTRIEHSLQTNGVLIDRAWAEFLTERGVRVGVSIDGPADIHDAHRTTRKGAGTLEAVMRGVAVLQEHAIPFDVIAVVSSVTMTHADRFMEFFEGLKGMRQLGLNIEETEGDHASATFASDGFEARCLAFMQRVQAWSSRTGIRVREFEAMKDLIVLGDERGARNTQNEPFAILAIACDGQICTFSPELLGLRHPNWESFSIGHVHSSSMADLLKSKRLLDLGSQINEGTDMCRRSCPYFALCGGGAPVNKLYENGTFASTQTRHCRSTVMTVANIVMEDLEAKIS